MLAQSPTRDHGKERKEKAREASVEKAEKEKAMSQNMTILFTEARKEAKEKEKMRRVRKETKVASQGILTDMAIPPPLRRAQSAPIQLVSRHQPYLQKYRLIPRRRQLPPIASSLMVRITMTHMGTTSPGNKSGGFQNKIGTTPTTLTTLGKDPTANGLYGLV